MHAYRARLCAMQLCPAHASAAARVWIVDPFALDHLDALAPLLGPDGPPKVLHDLGFDARLLLSRGLRLGNARDTAVHARFLGMAETGLGTLLSNQLGCTLAKAWQHHDWARRPWPAEAMRYLADDVAFLGPLHAALADRAAAADVAAEVDEETRYALARALEAAVDARPPFARVKGYRQLTGAARVALYALAALRETVAEALDLPPGRVVANNALLELARVRPRTVESLRAVVHGSNAPEALDARWIDALAEALRRRELDPGDRVWFEPRRPHRPQRSSQSRGRTRALAQRRGHPARGRPAGGIARALPVRARRRGPPQPRRPRAGGGLRRRPRRALRPRPLGLLGAAARALPLRRRAARGPPSETPRARARRAAPATRCLESDARR